ncbi:cysteine--tRNA ligase [Marinoscillum furvescens]|uniref:Cysteine--tRNA ligase n=1 Tax=Marinoscillum furvescens DSM 4134 TaxID=1122208 RepID=A0A3D9L662_MARFU|nr:cysteine--tRNA ligase [Marinoscillum furvescens]REE01657.1 cysteinyl-tRNA synthetase [Marinoscillum furvescens DSM 4134]
MIGKLRVVNSLTKQKEEFVPLNAPHVGMYVCGPTVYSDVHLGNVRTFISFDVIYRYLQFLGYKVRYVRNITDVGHLLDSGEDKISKKAKLENLEPMEIVQKYTNDFRQVMDTFNALPPDIEPTATGHLMEQIKMIQELLANGYAYESNGSIYFDISKYNEDRQYGKLSGRKTEDLLNQTRELDGQSDKRNPLDFALWKKAAPEHIMRWNTQWSDGFPGWHLECSVMSTKYLGEEFDIHGGGMDLKFPHHECEIAQNAGSTGKEGARYWLHTNMLTVNGQKMSKSLGNSFLPEQLITGNHELLERGYSPMTIRFFMLQSHYASTLDFSNEALNAAQKGYTKLANGLRLIKSYEYPQNAEGDLNQKQVDQINKICDNCHYAMNDDFNTALTIGHLFNLVKKINSIQTGQLKFTDIGEETFNRMKQTFIAFTEDVLGLKLESEISTDNLLEVILSEYKAAKESKDYDKVDELRAKLKAEGVIVKDMKSGVDWAFEE